MKFLDATKLGKHIGKNMKNRKNNKPLNSGVVGEKMIIASYDLMDIQQLEGMRIIINHLIKEKKHYKKIQSEKESTEDNINRPTNENIIP